jgi:hypothetical protein
MDRREFLEASTVIASGALLGKVAGRAPDPPMIGIQVGAVSSVDEGTDRVLDALVEMAGINTLFVATFTYGRGIAGRQLPNQPLPDRQHSSGGPRDQRSQAGLSSSKAGNGGRSDRESERRGKA